MSLRIFCYHNNYREGGGYLSICYLCQIPFSIVLVFVEDFPSLSRILYLLDVSSALPCLQKLLTAQVNLIAAFRERYIRYVLFTRHRRTSMTTVYIFIYILRLRSYPVEIFVNNNNNNNNIFQNTSGRVLILALTVCGNFSFNWLLTFKTSFLYLLIQLSNNITDYSH